MDEYDYTFVVTGPLTIEESFGDRAVLSGIFLRLDNTTNNGRTYVSEEGGQIAQGLLGMPIYFGARIGFDPILKKIGFRHNLNPSNLVGRVIKAIHDKTNKVIRGAVEIWNNTKFPDIVSKIQKGWGFSIRGDVDNFMPTGKINKLGNPIVKAINMKPDSLQLLSPAIPRGDDGAKVEDIKIVEETLAFDPCPWGFCTIDENGITMGGTGGNVVVPVEEAGVIETEGQDGVEGTNDGDVLETPPVETPVQPKIVRKIIRKVIVIEDPDTTVLYQ